MFRTLMLSLLLGSVAVPLRAESFGAGVSGSDTVPIADVLQNRHELKGKTVRVQGEIADVCTMMGCWIEVKASSGEKIRVKVEDGEIVFPVSVLGKQVIAEGVVEVLPMERDEYVAWMRHMAEEKGEAFDPERLGPPPYEIVQLRGLGAVVSEASPK